TEPPLDSTPRALVKARRRAWFAETGWVETPVYDRYALRPGDALEGPVIVEERESTTVVPPGDRLAVDDGLNLRLTIGQNTSQEPLRAAAQDRKSTRLNSSHDQISYAVFCL